MKRIISILLAVWFACSLGMGVFAAEIENPFQDGVAGESAPLYIMTDMTNPNTKRIYQTILEQKSRYRVISVYRDGVLSGEVRVEDELIPQEEISVFARFLDQYGGDVFFLENEDHRFVLFPDQRETLYPIEQFLEEDFTTPVPYPYPLQQYVYATCFLDVQSKLPRYYKEYKAFEATGYNDELIKTAWEFWPYYWENEKIRTKQDIQTGMILGACAIVVLVILLAVLWKKEMLKIDNEFINKIWVPALKKWRN